MILFEELFKLFHHVLRKWHSCKSSQRGHVNISSELLTVTNHLLQHFKIPHEESRSDGVDENSFFVEWVAELMRQPDRYGNELPWTGVEMATAGSVEANFAFLIVCIPIQLTGLMVDKLLELTVT